MALNDFGSTSRVKSWIHRSQTCADAGDDGEGAGDAGEGDDKEVPAELVELDNTLAADVAAAVAKAAAESGAGSMEGSDASGNSSPPSSPAGMMSGIGFEANPKSPRSASIVIAAANRGQRLALGYCISHPGIWNAQTPGLKKCSFSVFGLTATRQAAFRVVPSYSGLVLFGGRTGVGYGVVRDPCVG